MCRLAAASAFACDQISPHLHKHFQWNATPSSSLPHHLLFICARISHLESPFWSSHYTHFFLCRTSFCDGPSPQSTHHLTCAAIPLSCLATGTPGEIQRHRIRLCNSITSSILVMRFQCFRFKYAWVGM